MQVQEFKRMGGIVELLRFFRFFLELFKILRYLIDQEGVVKKKKVFMFRLERDKSYDFVVALDFIWITILGNNCELLSVCGLGYKQIVVRGLRFF